MHATNIFAISLIVIPSNLKRPVAMILSETLPSFFERIDRWPGSDDL
jgi:hypothetical protein